MGACKTLACACRLSPCSSHPFEFACLNADDFALFNVAIDATRVAEICESCFAMRHASLQLLVIVHLQTRVTFPIS
jgi:hypothetical protein